MKEVSDMKLKKIIIIKILFFLFLLSNAHSETNLSLEDGMAKAQFVVYGGIKSFKYTFIYKDKEIGEEEALKLIKTIPSNETHVVVKYTVIVDVEKTIKGSIGEGLVTFTWQDLADSMSPHINVPTIHEEERKFFWYSIDPIQHKYLKTSVSIFAAELNNPQIPKLFGVPN
jgi:hypothetical protein